MARVHAIAAGASLVLASPIAVAGCGGGGTAATAPTTTVARHVRRLPANAIRIHWKNEALVPASRAGRVCVVTYKTGRFCGRYVIGQIPAVVLTRKLRESGWIVVRSK
jgi:hypothetical protein